MKLNARQLRQLKQPKKIPLINRHPIYFILENIYDTYNIGGLFRLADALAIEKVYLCGECQTPPHHKIKKASVGTDKIVPWEYKPSVSQAIVDLNSKFKIKNSKQYQNPNDQNVIPAKATSDVAKAGIKKNYIDSCLHGNDNLFPASNFGFRIFVIAVEQHPKAIPYSKASYPLPLALIFGNETFGIIPETLKLADQIVEIPLFGINKSLNVIVSAAIVAYHIIYQLSTKNLNVGRVAPIKNYC